MRKKLMILLVVTLFITMMFSTGCKKKFDIQGTWKVTYKWTGFISLAPYTIIFTGSKTSGTFIAGKDKGIYTVTGKKVTWTFTLGTVYTGTSTGDNNMSGTMTSNKGGTGTWTAVRK